MNRQVWGAGLATLAAMSGCSGDATDVGACTAMFATLTVSVVDGEGQPVDGATVTTVLVRTGQVLTSNSFMLLARGIYPLVDDGSIGILRPAGDAVQAHITRGALSRTADYVVSVPGGCHVSLVSGPATVTLE